VKHYKYVLKFCNLKAYPPSPFGEKRIVISYLPAPCEQSEFTGSFVIRKGWQINWRVEKHTELLLQVVVIIGIIPNF
jgi:hypothetical protein